MGNSPLCFLKAAKYRRSLAASNFMVGLPKVEKYGIERHTPALNPLSRRIVTASSLSQWLRIRDSRFSESTTLFLRRNVPFNSGMKKSVCQKAAGGMGKFDGLFEVTSCAFHLNYFSIKIENVIHMRIIICA